MASSNIKLFDENKGNMLSDSEFSISNQRMNGLQTGVASSQLQNKAMYQASLVAYAIAQVMMQNGKNANDTDAVSAFVANLSGTMLQKVADKASSAEAAAGVLTNKYISPATLKAAALLLSGGVMTGTLDMNNNKIINLPTPTSNSEPATKEYVDGTLPFKTVNVINKRSISCGGGYPERIEFDNQISEDILKKSFAIKLKFKPTNIKTTTGTSRFGFGESSGDVGYYYDAKNNSEIETLVVLNYHSNAGGNQDAKTSSYIISNRTATVIDAKYGTKRPSLLFYPEYKCTLSYLIVDLWYI